MNKGFENKNSNIKVLAIQRDNGGCGYYRISLPYKTLNHHAEDIDVLIVDGWHRDRMKYLDQADVVVVPRLTVKEEIDELYEIREQTGCKIVIDHDDNIFDINPFSPHYDCLGTREVNIMSGGEIVNIWKNGRNNFHIFDNLVNLDNAVEAMEIADAVTVTTPFLGKKYSKHNNNIHILANSIDISKWSKHCDCDKSDEIRLYWAGGHSHYHDWYTLHDVLPEIFKQYKNLKLIIKGHCFRGTLKGVPEDRIEVYGWSHVQAYPYESALLKPTIGLIPLVVDDFNICKSEIKLVEMGALSVPCVVSNTYPYLLFGDHAVYVDNKKDSWYEGICTLVEDTILRASMGARARQTVENEYSIQNNWVNWYNFIKDIT